MDNSKDKNNLLGISGLMSVIVCVLMFLKASYALRSWLD